MSIFTISKFCKFDTKINILSCQFQHVGMVTAPRGVSGLSEKYDYVAARNQGYDETYGSGG